MKQLPVQRINCITPKAEELGLLLDKASVPFHKINTVNWEAFPYCPEAAFRIAHNGKAVFLNYRVNEPDIRAINNQDNGRVCEDSCVEFFVSFGGSSYYNIECNCIGKILLASGAGRGNRLRLPENLRNRIDRWASLGTEPVENLSGDWEVSLIIPKEVFCFDTIQTLDNAEASGNFYKCGDCLQTPHFLSWNPIQTETPDFHRPEFFGQLLFG